MISLTPRLETSVRRVLTAVVAGAAMLLLAAPTASAQAPTGPDTAACAQANVRVEAAAGLAVDAADALAAAQAGIQAALLVEVRAAEADQIAALDALQRLGPTSDRAGLANLLAAVARQQLRLQAALEVVENAAAPSALTEALAEAQADLDLAIDVRVRDCTAPPVTTTPTTTTTAPPTSTVTTTPPTVAPGPFADCAAVRAADEDPIASTDPRFQDSLDSDNDGLGCELNEGLGSDTDVDDGGQVTVIPSDAPETGDGSTEQPFAVRLALISAFLVMAAFSYAAGQRGLVESFRK